MSSEPPPTGHRHPPRARGTRNPRTAAASSRCRSSGRCRASRRCPNSPRCRIWPRCPISVTSSPPPRRCPATRPGPGRRMPRVLGMTTCSRVPLPCPGSRRYLTSPSYSQTLPPRPPSTTLNPLRQSPGLSQIPLRRPPPFPSPKPLACRTRLPRSRRPPPRWIPSPRSRPRPRRWRDT